MSGGSTVPYGNVKLFEILSVTPSGPNVGATSITIATGGAVVTVAVPGILLGDVILDCNRPSNTINGNLTPAAPWVSVANAYASANGVLSIVLGNTSTLAVTTPIDVYQIAVGRPDTPNAPSTTPTGFY